MSTAMRIGRPAPWRAAGVLGRQALARQAAQTFELGTFERQGKAFVGTLTHPVVAW